jgi:uncharacterized integral membrane protein (TIGR00698 family)
MFKKVKIEEDWVVVIMAWICMLGALFHFIPSWPSFKWSNIDQLVSDVLTLENSIKILGLFFLFIVLFGITFFLKGSHIKKTIYGFSLIFGLTILAQIIGSNIHLQNSGFEPVIFSLVLGIFISNVFEIPEWIRSSLNGELFVKIGLVILGSSVLFGDVVKSGSLGLIQSILVVLSVWYFAFWLCKKFKVDKELTMMLSSAVSICGISAAIATSGVIKGDAKKLSYVVSLVMFTALPMIIAMPILAKWMGLSEEVTGAWLGGSIDTTGAVVASGSLVGDIALKVSTIIKFSQNILLGIAAFIISVYWTYSKTEVEHEKPTLKVIWDRFPKFVVGFIVTSIIFSFIIDKDTVESLKEINKNIQGFWFALAFTSIGLEIKFKDLIQLGKGKPAIVFIVAQIFNILITLLIATLLF